MQQIFSFSYFILKKHKFRHIMYPSCSIHSKNCTFAYLIIADMSKDFANFGRTGVHIVLCVAVVLFFGRNCVLRMPATGAMYKEYLTGLLALALFYGNMFFLFPQLFLRERYSIYLGTIAISLLGAAGAELALIYPQISPFLENIFGSDSDNHVVVTYWILILLRDLGFILASFAICHIRHQTQLKESYKARLKEIAHEVDVQTTNNTIEFANLRDILYCLQRKNVTWIFMTGGNFHTCYGSLQKMKNLIGVESTIDVSKGLFVMQDKILTYDCQSITIKDSVLNKTHSFKWGQDYYEYACQQFHTNLPSDKTMTIIENVPKEAKTPMPAPMSRKNPTAFFKLHPNLRPIYSYIYHHPICKTNEISSKLSIPTGTLYRTLKQLKSENLIEYIGSKKTGGYRVVES